MSAKEKKRVESHSNWYLKEQLLVDKKLIEFRYRSLKPHFKGKSALELGPAEGHMTRLLLQDFEKVTVVEGAQELLSQIPEDPRLHKINMLFENYNPNEKFETCILDHVLEHVDHPVDLLSQCKKWMTTNAHLLIGVPNGHSFHRLLGVKMRLLQSSTELNSRDLAVGHRRVYTTQTLHRDIESAGLEIKHFGGSFLKIISNEQMQNHWSEALLEGCFQLGKDFQENASDIFAVCTLKA